MNRIVANMKLSLIRVYYLLHLKIGKHKSMKTLYRILLFTLCISLYSCDKEEYLDQDTLESQSVSKTNDVYFDTQSEEQNIENVMQWVSYLAAQALIRNESAESFFVDVLANSSSENIIPLENLLGTENDFSDAFIEEYLYYLGPICRVDKPLGDPTPDTDPGSGSEEFMYIYHLLNDYDFEFNLPNGYDQNLNIVKSTARSNILVGSLQGFKHFDRCKVEELLISSGTGGNVLILNNSENR